MRTLFEGSDPDTAPAACSIWNSIDRIKFEQRIKAISDKGHVAGRHTYSGCTRDDDSTTLSVEVEQGLADDLAFIAACEPQVGFVSAVTVEQCESSSSILVRLAANEGVSSNVQKTFDEIFEVLRGHARKDIEKDQCQDQLFELIVRLNCNKILGRLGSARFRRPAHLSTSRKPLTERVRRLLDNDIQSLSLNCRHPGIQNLENEISSFERAFAQLEDGKKEEYIPNIKRAIDRAFRLTENGLGLPDRLRALGFCDSLLDNRDVREVGKVSNYWRIARHLTVCSRRFRSCFVAADWRSVHSYGPSKTSKIFAQQYVHAEIQLLVHFELQPTLPMPRAIGGSKEACFLCDSFIRAHGRYSITGAHRQMVPQWTVPDLKEYQPQTVRKFRVVLSHVFQEVKSEHLEALKKGLWRPFPLQSAINLNAIQLATPSTSTLPLQSESCTSGDVLTSQTNRTNTRSNVEESNRHACAQKRGEAAHVAASIAEVAPAQERTSSGSASRNEGDAPIDITVHEQLMDSTRWISLFASFACSTIEKMPMPYQQKFSGGSVSLEPAGEYDCARTIQLTDTPPGTEVLLARDGDDTLDELAFVLVGVSGQRVRIRCRWHKN